MGGLFHLFDFNHASTSRKLPTQKRRIDGLEAPRNSLELPIETSQSYAISDKIRYSHQVNHKPSKHNHFPSGAPMKKLINEEISKDSDSRRNIPSVVARLMGMDILPSEIKPTIHVREKKSQIKQNNLPRKEQLGSSSYLHKPLDLEPYKHITHDLLPDLSNHNLKLGKPQPREHPQEEQLQKFKKEFEAWQAARVWEQSRFVEGLHREKRDICSDSRRIRGNEKPTEGTSHTSQLKVKSSTKERVGLHHHRYKGEEFQAKQKESMILWHRNKTTDFEPLMNGEPKTSKYSVPTRIVILKPGLDRSPDSEESCAGSSETKEDEGSIENFLEEVKERLRFEMQGKRVKRDFVVIRDGNEIPFNEKPSNPKKIAQNIAKQVRESVSRDFGVKLLRSESTKSYGSEIQVGGPDSPEFMNRRTRRLLSERLTNVIKKEADVDVDTIGRKSSLARDVFSSGKRCYRENVKDESEIQTRSFKHGEKNCQLHHTGEMPPRNLVRSMSAPVSGTSFGKLLLEDRHVLTGAHIRRKHEIAEDVSVEVTKTRKEKFSLGGKGSNLKHNFTLTSRLFGRKMQLEEEMRNNESIFVRDDFMSGPTVMMNLGSAEENSTEVPPSPASVCSSIHEELGEPADFPSPISTIDAAYVMEDRSALKGSTEINPNLSVGNACAELPKQLNQVEFEDTAATKEQHLEAELMAEEAYIRELLVVSGLYDGSWLLSIGSVSRWVPLGNWVFDKVEEPSYRRKGNVNIEGDHHGKDQMVDRKVLFDLSNEALSTILGPYVTNNYVSEANKDDDDDGTMILRPTIRMPPPRGRKLLEDVWRMIRMYVYPPPPPDDHDGSSSCFYSLDGIVARELGMNNTHWFGGFSTIILHNNNNNLQFDDVVGRVVEGFILEELIEETVRVLYGGFLKFEAFF